MKVRGSGSRRRTTGPIRHGGLAAALVVPIVLALSACSSGSQSTGASGTVKIAIADEPTTLDPAKASRDEELNVTTNVFNGLTRFDPSNGGVAPDLASKWTTSADQRTWTFTLRSGVSFQEDYGPVTAGDVVYTFKRAIELSKSFATGVDLSNIKTVTAPDDTTVVFTLKKPDAFFTTKLMGDGPGAVVPKKAVDKLGDAFGRTPVGTGAFSVSKFSSNEVVLLANKSYFRGAPKSKEIDLQVITSETSRLAALKSGNVDIAFYFTTAANINAVRQASNLSLSVREGVSIVPIVFNTQKRPFNDARVRQAFAYAMNSANDVKSVYDPAAAAAADSLLPANNPYYASSVPKYQQDIAKAKQLLAAAGFPNGLSATWLESSAKGVSPLEQLLQSDLGKAGIHVKFQLLETGVYNDRRVNGDFQIATVANGGIAPDSMLGGYLDPNNKRNRSRYNNPEVTRMLADATTTADLNARKQIYAQVQQLALTELPYIPLYTLNDADGVSKSVTGFVHAGPGKEIDLSTVAKK